MIYVRSGQLVGSEFVFRTVRERENENNTMYSTKDDAVILKFSTNITIIYFDALCIPSAIPMLEVVVC